MNQIPHLPKFQAEIEVATLILAVRVDSTIDYSFAETLPKMD